MPHRQAPPSKCTRCCAPVVVSCFGSCSAMGNWQTEVCTVIVIFGWEKQTRPLGEVGRLHCFDCKRATPWFAVAQSEWVTLFFLRVLKFSSQHCLHCTGCGATLAL